MDLIVAPFFALIIFGLLALILSVGGVIFWIWMLVECLRYESSEGNTRLVWLLVILFLSLFGALLYFLIRRPQRRSEMGR